MLPQFKIILLALIFHFAHSNSKDFDIESTTSNESCTEPNEATSESNCYCYSQPEMDFEYSSCVPKKCPLDDPSYFLEQGKCFYLEKKLKNFKDARENCKEKGGKLHEPKDVVNNLAIPYEINSKLHGILGKVMNLGSNTFGTHSKGLTKLAILPNYRRPQMLCIALRLRQKSGRILVNIVVLKLKFTVLTKNVLLNFYSSLKKKSERFGYFLT